MRGLIQRVNSASVTVGDSVVASIESGLLLFLGIEKNDCEDKAEKLLNKVLKYRVFADSAGKMNQCLLDKEGDLLIVSQFTLAASTNKGLRPSFTSAASTEKAKQRDANHVKEVGQYKADVYKKSNAEFCTLE